MTAEDWIQLTDQLPKNSRVTLTGGEPIVIKNFKKIFDHVALRFECNMITNAYCLPRILSILCLNTKL